MLKICLIDSHPAFRLGLRQVLQTNFENVHIEEFSNYTLFILAKIQAFDLVVASINEDTQQHIIRKLNRFPYSHPKVLLFYTSGHYNTVLTHLSKKVGAFLNKNSELIKISEAFGKMIKQPDKQQTGKISREIRSPVFQDYVPDYRLSEREFEIACYLAKGMKTVDISNMMRIKPSTVSTHKHRIFKKTETANIIELRDLMYS
jgi:two-component system response regulator EvgA